MATKTANTTPERISTRPVQTPPLPDDRRDAVLLVHAKSNGDLFTTTADGRASFDPQGPTCDDHGIYWPLFWKTGPEPVCPTCLTEMIGRGEARLGDYSTARKRWEALRNDAGITPLAARPYSGVFAADRKVDKREQAQRIRKYLGMQPGDAIPDPDDPNTPTFISATELASLLNVDSSTIRRWAGQKLPAAMKVGGTWKFRTSALWRLYREPS